MKIKDMKKEELEVLSYADLTEMIIKENKKPMNTPSIFKKICELLELGEEEYTNQIGDYYTSLTTDKRFILLDSAEWDLKDKHKVEIVMEDDEDEDAIFEEESDEDEDLDDETVEDESIEITDDEIDLDDGMEELSIVTDDEIEEEM